MPDYNEIHRPDRWWQPAITYGFLAALAWALSLTLNEPQPPRRFPSWQLLIALFLFYRFLTALINKQAIHIGPTGVRVASRPLPAPGTEQMPREEIASVFYQRTLSEPAEYLVGVQDIAGNRVILATNLESPQSAQHFAGQTSAALNDGASGYPLPVKVLGDHTARPHSPNWIWAAVTTWETAVVIAVYAYLDFMAKS